ncbi:unnamed protein product [Cylicocyclus nassatus]|uniref:Uncharacterized protein n=1 Tax=Cylicocyclus nassatus TaxID=53992 RepID=A0AA36DLY4_CYLNA|nr:unnamed protein product [Cylicocyclus nassatus]CAJ0604968.1 unnamed protein product [Cylicocyclus nassatus]
MGKQSTRSERSNKVFDIVFTHDLGDASINSISKNVLVQGPPVHMQADDSLNYPVIFILMERPTSRVDKARLRELVRDVSYAKPHSGRRVAVEEAQKVLMQKERWNVMFDNAIDAVVINRNTRTTKRNTFTEQMFEVFAAHGIKPSMISLDADGNTRDLPKGTSISLCVPEEEDESYTRTHTSVYWKFSSHTPREENDCTYPAFLRVFDEKVGYSSVSEQFQYPDDAERRTVAPVVNEEGDEDVVADVPVSGPEVPVPQTPPLQTEPTQAHAGAGDVAVVPHYQCSAFSYEEKTNLMTWVGYLYRQALSNENVLHKEARERAREAMLAYESGKRCNFFCRDHHMLVNSGHFVTDKEKKILQNLKDEKYQYFKPLFPNEWVGGKRVLKVRCEPCYEYYRSGQVKGSPYPISSKEGTEFTSSVEKTLQNHIRSDHAIHQAAVEYYVRKTNDKVNSYLDDVDSAHTGSGTGASSLFMLAYAAAKIYLPPYQFPTLCETVSKLGLQIGNKHHTRDGFVQMTSYISKKMKDTLIDYLIKNQSPFSLLVDTSTDPDSKQILLLFVRFPDRTTLHPTTHFLEAVEMVKAETGKYIFETIYAYFSKAGLLNEFIWNLVAVATDGASAMSAEGGLRGILNKNISQSRKDILASRGATQEKIDSVLPNPIIWIHCMAHKIELALADALAEADEEFLRWRKFATAYLNRLRSFFAAPSRKRVLLEVDKTLSNERFVNLKRIIAVRWTSSEENAIHSFLKMYKHVWLALETISKTAQIPSKERLKAGAFLHVIKSLKFYRYMVFQLQVLGEIGTLSREAQDEASTLWKAQTDLNTLLARLDKAAESPHLNTKTRPFLESILCKPVNEAGNFRQNALDSPDCRKWFWNGWQNEESAACQILYKIADDLHVFEFNIETQKPHDGGPPQQLSENCYQRPG